jgi:hypothetical protein
MTAEYGYMLLRSDDKKTLVQVYTDLETGSILYAEIRTRRSPWHRWELPTELKRLEL